jgi:hypothetical protein
MTALCTCALICNEAILKFKWERERDYF